jgi:hypothetical protein
LVFAIGSLGDYGKVKFWLDLIICIFSITVAILTGLQEMFGNAVNAGAGASLRVGAIGRPVGMERHLASRLRRL